MPSIKARVAALEAKLAEEASKDKGSIAQRLHDARMRRHAMTIEQIKANRELWLQRAATTPPPPPGTMARRLWDAAMRQRSQQE